MTSQEDMAIILRAVEAGERIPREILWRTTSNQRNSIRVARLGVVWKIDRRLREIVEQHNVDLTWCSSEYLLSNSVSLPQSAKEEIQNLHSQRQFFAARNAEIEAEEAEFDVLYSEAEHRLKPLPYLSAVVVGVLVTATLWALGAFMDIEKAFWFAALLGVLAGVCRIGFSKENRAYDYRCALARKQDADRHIMWRRMTEKV